MQGKSPDRWLRWDPLAWLSLLCSVLAFAAVFLTAWDLLDVWLCAGTGMPGCDESVSPVSIGYTIPALVALALLLTIPGLLRRQRAAWFALAFAAGAFWALGMLHIAAAALLS